MSFGARARIRPGAIRHNLQVIKARAPGTRVMAVIKANAYGHGLIPVSRTLTDADCLAVARLAEARALRAAGVDKPIALFGGALSADDLDEVAALDLQLSVHDEAQLRWLEERDEKVPVVWLKVDTGMNRLGVHPHAASKAIDRLRSCTERLGVMTHFSSADETDNPVTREQLARFVELIDGFDGDVSVANSAGLLAWRDELEQLAETRREGQLWIRPGLALYGISPIPGRYGTDFGLEPAMQFEATMLSVKTISAGDGVGYGGAWHAGEDTTLGIIAVGYGDGYTRYVPSGTPVLVNGRRVPVIGRISMDLTAVDLGKDSRDKIGDTVILWGDGLPVEEVALHANTIPYQLVTGLTHREESILEDP